MTFKELKLFLHNNNSTILTGLSIVGIILTTYNAIVDTRKMIYRLDDEDYERHKNNEPELTRKEEAIIIAKSYIPTAISAAGTIGCIIGSHICETRKTESVMSAYLLSQTMLQEYQRKVVDRIGVNKERELRDEVIQEIADLKSPPVLYSDGCIGASVIETGKGNTLFYDEVIPGGLYFKSDINFLKAVRNDLNYEVMSEMYFDWNEILYRWGLPYFKYGCDRIMTYEHPFDPRFVPEMMENGQVRIVISYDLIPADKFKER